MLSSRTLEFREEVGTLLDVPNDVLLFVDVVGGPVVEVPIDPFTRIHPWNPKIKIRL